MTSSKRIRQASAAPVPFRLSRLASACVLATGAVAAGSALAQPTSTYNATFPGTYLFPTVNMWTIPGVYPTVGPGFAFTITSAIADPNNLGSQLPDTLNMGNGIATIDANGGTTINGGGGTNTVTSNSFFALARGNSTTNFITMANLVNNVGGDGLGIGFSQVNGGDGTQDGFAGIQTASVTNSNFLINVTGAAPASHDLSSNSISASVGMNVVDSSITGTAPIGYSSTATGVASADTTVAAPTVNSSSQGGLSINNVQSAINSSRNAGSSASVSGSTVTLDVHLGTAPQSLPLTVNSNNISADFGANTGTNTIRQDAGVGAGGFTGAASVVSSQFNYENSSTASSAPTAQVTTGTITADIRDTGAGDSALSSTLDLTSNNVSATSTGNKVGNTLSFQSGSPVAGAGTASGTTASGLAGVYNTNASADLAIANLQVNSGTGVGSAITDTTVKTFADTVLAGGVVSATSNNASASATGNVGNSTFSATATTFNANVAVGSTQTNDTSAAPGNSITADNTNSTIGAQVGLGTTATGGSVVVTANNISATAGGNSNSSAANITPTNSLTALPSNGIGNVSSTGLTVATGGTASSFGDAGVVVSTSQSNFSGLAPASITSTLTDATVTAQAFDTNAAAVVPVDTATISVTSNTLKSAASGNTNTNSATLSGATVNTSAAVSAAQFNDNFVTGTTQGSTGVGLLTGDATASTLGVTSNTVAASGVGNSNTNSLTVAANTLQLAPAQYGTNTPAETATSDASTGSLTTSAAFSIATAQHNEGAIMSSNLSAIPFAQIVAGTTAGTGIVGSTLNATGNQATSTTTNNFSSNTFTLGPGTLTTSDAQSAQVASVANLQTNQSLFADIATVGGIAPGQAIGISYLGSVDAASTLTATANNVAATARSNDTVNSLTLTNGGYTPAAQTAAASGTITSTDNGATAATAVNSDFAVLNHQTDVALDRIATVTNSAVGIDNGGDITTLAGTLTVTGNTTTAEVRHNNASNTLSLAAGAGNLATSGGLLNQQNSNTTGTAHVDSSFRVTTGNTTGANVAVGADISVTGNTSTALAVGNSAGNAVSASAVGLTGNANITAGTGLSTYDTSGTGTLSVVADFGLGNQQTQTGALTANSISSVRIGVDDGTVAGGSLTMTGNTLNSQGQANSAHNTLDLAGANGTSSAAIVSGQAASADVTATHVSPAGESSAFLISNATVNANTPASIDGTPVTVTGNAIKVNAGQNAADNWLSSAGTSVAGPAYGDNTVSYTVGGLTSVGTDLGVTNVQISTGGNVTATAITPGDIGVRSDSIGDTGATGSTVTVTGNSILTNAQINNSSNMITLPKAGGATPTAVSATIGVLNVQSNDVSQNVLSSVGDNTGATQINIGIAPATAGGVVVDTTPVDVTGNTLSAIAGGNKSVNTATSAAVAGMTLPDGTVLSGQAISLLNDQTSGAALTSNTSYAAFGVNAAAAGSLAPGATSVSNTTVNVTGNTASASSNANTANNTVGASAANMTGGDTAATTFLLTSNQTSNQSATGIQATVEHIDAGITATVDGTALSGVAASTVNVLSNAMQSSANANNATNTVNIATTNGMSAAASAALNNTQTNSDVLRANTTDVNAGVFTAGSTNGIDGTTVNVTGNTISAVAGASTATNALNGTAVSILVPSSATPQTYTLTNTQTNNTTGAATSLVQNVALGSTADTVGLTTTSPLNVLANTVTSSAYGNNGDSRIELVALAGSSSMYGALLNNTQSNAAVLSSTADTINAGFITPNASVVDASPMQVTGNAVNALAGANTATNVLNSTTAAAIGNPVGAPSYQLLNGQSSTGATVTAMASNINLGMGGGGAPGSVSISNSPMNVLANTILASGYGNSASNSIGLTGPLTGTSLVPTALLASNQLNTSNISATVTNATIGMGVAGGFGLLGVNTNALTVSGNSITAQAIGNSAVNRITTK
jgi:hypothetical protein